MVFLPPLLVKKPFELTCFGEAKDHDRTCEIHTLLFNGAVFFVYVLNATQIVSTIQFAFWFFRWITTTKNFRSHARGIMNIFPLLVAYCSPLL